MLSIVIPLFNKQYTIKRAILSILEQDSNEFEIIVVDDGSFDDGYHVAASINDDRIHIFKKQNGGPSSARNFGVDKTNGDWIIFLDADDYFEPNVFSHILSVINMHEECDFFCFNHFIERDGVRRLYNENAAKGYLENNFYRWCTNQFMPRAGAAVFRKKLLIQHPFDESLKRYEDAASLFEIMRDHRVFISSVPVMTYNQDSLEASAARKDISEDFIGHLNPNGKGWWEQYALYQLYCQGCSLYPNEMSRIYSTKDFYNWKVRILDYYIRVKDLFS